MLVQKPTFAETINTLLKLGFALRPKNFCYSVLCALLVHAVGVHGQINESIKWKGVATDNTFGHSYTSYIALDGGEYDFSKSNLPFISLQNSRRGKFKVSKILNYSIETEPLSVEEKKVIQKDLNSISAEPNFNVFSQYVNQSTITTVRFVPLVRQNGEVKKITKVSLTYNKQQFSYGSRSTWKENSVLSSGTWYRVGVPSSGMVRLDYNFFKSVGFTPSVTDLRRLRVYTAQGGLLPENNIDPFVSDLEAVPMLLKGEEDGKIDKDDYAVFYVPGPHDWKLDGNQFLYSHNIYADSSYFFFSFNSNASPAVLAIEPSASAGFIISSFDEYKVHERENTNLISSGRIWFGEHFNATTAYSIDFNIPDIITSQDATIRVSSAIRSLNSSSTLVANAGSIGSGSFVGGNVSGNYTDDYAVYNSFSFSGKPSRSKFSVLFNFSKGVGDAQAWLDKVQINCKRNLTFSGSQMAFRNISTFNNAQNYTYELARPSSNLQIWNVSNPLKPRNVSYSLANGKARFNVPGGDTTEFIAFNPSIVEVPNNFQQVENQNLHELRKTSIDMVIISPKVFSGYADELAEIHIEEDNLNTVVVDVKQIYNEFSGGRQDLSAIKNFLRYLKENSPTGSTGPKYVLLFGDASYDYKDRVTGNTNFIPIYQTVQSLSPTGSIASDDYIGYLAPDFSGEITEGIMEVGVGRFPVRNARQAAAAVNKVRSYYSKASYGPWRNKLTFIADDEDNNRHMVDVDILANQVDTIFPKYNVNKILADAYPQRATPGGHRYPDVNDAIDNAVLRGSLTINYLGHGGELGWAHERILEVSQINKWSNLSNLPLLITATCEFSRFDDPKRTSAGEFVFLNPDGGGIALLTTTRLVYSTPNFTLARRFNAVAYDEYDEYPRLGDLARLTKETQFSLNSRVFALLGDPAVRLAYPQEKVVATSVPDTIRALDLVTISGEVRNRKTNQLLTNFNGIVYPTVFDKEKTLKTLNNDSKSGSLEFKSRNSVLFRGKASVKNGKFKFSFVVPKDIDYSYGPGKISFYADNGDIDANGYENSFIVGGKNPNAAEDKIGPQINLFMNDSTFVNGGMTDENPSIYAKLFDQNGINTTGSGVGHDLAATIDGNTIDQIVLNEFYETELNSYQKGSVTYPLTDLSEGEHNLQLKAWDVYNNSSTADLAFVVTSSEDLALDHVLNYPNPFTTNTDFYLEHNHPNQDLFVRIQVFTISGKVVKTIDGTYNSKGFRLGPINWNGLDDFGDKIGKGVYIYKVYVKSPNGDIADKFEKLVILH